MVKINYRTGLISKKSNFARAGHFFCTFLCRCFARLQRETSTNFLVTQIWRKCRTCSRSLFFHCRFFFTLLWWPLAFPILSLPLQNFHLVFPTKKMCPLFFISRSKPALWPFFSLSFAGLPPTFFFFSVFLLLYIPNLWI